MKTYLLPSACCALLLSACSVQNASQSGQYQPSAQDKHNVCSTVALIGHDAAVIQQTGADRNRAKQLLNKRHQDSNHADVRQAVDGWIEQMLTLAYSGSLPVPAGNEQAKRVGQQVRNSVFAKCMKEQM